MRISQKVGFLAVFIGLLGISSGARAIAFIHPQMGIIAQSVSLQEPEVNDKNGVMNPTEASDESKERDREVQDDQVPTSLTNVGKYGETLYDMAKVGDWTKASTNLTLLQQAARSLPSNIDRKEVTQLNSTITKLNRSIASKNQPIALRKANQVTLIAANMTKEFKPKVPVEVTLLDYYGREFEIWSASKNAAQLKTTAKEFHQTWNTLRPAVQARNSSEAKTFDTIVAQVQAAKAPAEYGRFATPVLNAVDNLEKVFQ